MYLPWPDPIGVVIRILFDWVVPGALFAFFLVGAFGNADSIFGITGATRRAKAEGRHVSGIPFAPGIAGAIAVANAPLPALVPWFWVPLVLDPGTSVYLLFLAIGVIAAPIGIIAAALGPKEKPAPDPEREARERERAARLAELERATVGCLLGTAVGDALGLASEGLSALRQRKMFPDPGRYHLLFGRGMCSDDTEHACMLAQSLIATRGAIDLDSHGRWFASDFAWRLRFWLLSLPAGVGLATLRAILKLWLFIPPRWSGVRSAGNGPAMRSALLGVVYGDEPERMRALVAAATRITHTDRRAEQAAHAVALAAYLSAQSGGNVGAARYVDELARQLGEGAEEFIGLAARMRDHLAQGGTVAAFAAALGCERGVTGYCMHTVPAALCAWLAHPGDYRAAVIDIIRCGGDTDTTAAIVGAIAGAGVGREGIPGEWLARLVEYPRTVRWMDGLARQLARARVAPLESNPVPRLPVVRLLLRNLFFLAVVLAHGFRRLLPPY